MHRVLAFFLVLLLAKPSFAIEMDDFQLYGSIALVSTMNFENGSQALGDNSSRLGMKLEKDDLFEGWLVGFLAEWSVSTNRNNSGFGSSNFNGKKYDVITNDGPFGNRLGYLWVQKEDFFFAAGKMWSAFYDIPEFTDLFLSDGARASAVYTVTGEVDGTYRASEVIQARYKYKDFQFALQTKLTGKEAIEYDFDDDGTAESTLVYKQVQAASIRYQKKHFTLGISAINMMFDNNGDGESQLSLSYGLKTNYQNYFLHAVYTRAKDLELNTINNQFVNSDGTEVIVGKTFSKDVTLMLGLNHLYRTESGPYDLMYYYASLSRRIKDLSVALEFVHGDTTESDGSQVREKLLKLAGTLRF